MESRFSQSWHIRIDLENNLSGGDIDSNIAEQGAIIRGQYKQFKAMDDL